MHMKWLYLAVVSLLVGPVCAEPVELPAVSGQYIRIELPGENRVLSLAEVRVFSKGINLALNKEPLPVPWTAKQMATT